METSTTAAMKTVLSKLRQVSDETLIFHAGRVLTGLRTGERVLTDQVVIVENGAIVKVAPWAEYAPAEGDPAVIDISDKTLMPGMVETHLHVTGEWAHDPHGTHLEPFGEARVLRGLLDTLAVFNLGFTSMFSMGHGHPNALFPDRFFC